MKQLSTLSLSLCLLCAAQVSHASDEETSREYKLMLKTSQFTYGAESSNVNQYFQEAKTLLQNRLARDVTGSMYLNKTRQVRFFDTQGSCPLNGLGYIFRDRVENGNSEVTLKYRGYDRYIAAFENVSSNTANAETKLEADIGSNSTQSFNVVYSHSTTAPNTRTLNDFLDIHTHFPSFKTNYGFSDSQALNVVGNFTAYEKVYKGGIIDLGEHDAEISITLWYNGQPNTSNTNPVVVEMSFKYEDPAADYTKKVVGRAAVAFKALKEMTTWTAPAALTKTQYAYQYQPNFCS